MKLFGLSVLVLLLPCILAAPTTEEAIGGVGDSDENSLVDRSLVARAESDDVRILNFALSFEYLATAFYEKSLPLFSDADFANNGVAKDGSSNGNDGYANGYGGAMKGFYEQIYQHRQGYVSFLENAITATGNAYITPCTYDFTNFTKTLTDFVNLSEWFETASTSMYNGALAHINDKTYAAQLGSILGVQARHSAWIHSAVQHRNPWNTMFETPLLLNQTWSLGNPFYASCPTSGPGMDVLPPSLTDYPTFSISPKSISPSSSITLDLSAAYTADPTSLPSSKSSQNLYAYFGLGTTSYLAPLKLTDAKNQKYSMTVPAELASTGVVYVSILKASASEAAKAGFGVTDENMVAGPKLWMFAFGADGSGDVGYELFSAS
ncbi:hypothetical protein CC1G_04176 [Coprinopsis cinerea okayama7|uniref:Uncharacterized protein n=1 Tax=Coprinopsis cinerea (strain Okayama-7 / 130 / ATCC MYA-4618 / FGSC 9003) TaxID=240176 RepID=A8NW93_COPC7|nr:hypothetical protein CC1G_04176 [Coprinopsis cinerea okayama7\|eukprot:XP_001836863.1 hypothetical protein CC1G_04176 [Coprinopsis cinerea okayama7\